MPKLKTEINTPEMDARILDAAKESLGEQRNLSLIFEHGQHWIEDLDSGAQWSVVDAEGGNSIDGFDFEQVTQGDED
jgi:hypothetical protein